MMSGARSNNTKTFFGLKQTRAVCILSIRLSIKNQNRQIAFTEIPKFQPLQKKLGTDQC